MKESTVEIIDTIIHENKRLLERLIHNFDKGDYPGVIEDITEMGTNTKELEKVCYLGEYNACKQYVYDQNIPIYNEVIEKFKEKCR